MGGSGGFFTRRTDPDDLRRQVRAAEATASDEEFTSTVNGKLADLLARFNDRDTEATKRILTALAQDLADSAAIDVDTRLGGSVAKHTYVDGLSDVDALVVFRQDQVGDVPPDFLRGEIIRHLASRHGVRAVKAGSLAVTVTTGALEIQLIPSLRAGDTLRIPSAGGAGWASINPRAFAEMLTTANQRQDGKLVPCIKLAKSIVASLPAQQQLSGYHVEALAVEAFRAYEGPRTPKAMLRHFFESAPQRLLTPIVDSTGQSWHVDDALGPANSVPRRVAADAYGRIARRMANADGAGSAAMWDAILEGE